MEEEFDFKIDCRGPLFSLAFALHFTFVTSQVTVGNQKKGDGKVGAHISRCTSFEK